MTDNFPRSAVTFGGLALFAWALVHGGLLSEWSALIVVLLAGLARLANLDLADGESLNLEAAINIAALLIFPLPKAVVMAFAGPLLPAVIRPQRHRIFQALDESGERAIATALAGNWLIGHFLSGRGPLFLNLASWEVVLAITASITYFLALLLVEQLLRHWQQPGPFWPVLLGSVSRWLMLYFSIACAGILMAVMYRSMGTYALLLFSVPLIVIHYSFKLFLDIKSTYHHTLAALTRVLGLEDPHQRSHGERVADLCLEVGKQMGLYGDRLEGLGYAAMLHDIGKLGLDADSFDSYLDEIGVSENGVNHSGIGADILEQVEFLRPFANIVRHHHRPYSGIRRHDADHPLESRIIAVVDLYNRLTYQEEAERRLTPHQAVAKIKREATEFDPRVVRALINVLKRQRQLAPASLVHAY